MATSTATDEQTSEHDYAHAPLIEHIRITGFQSLHDIDLELEPFTVIVGPSSSGKSALVRALRTLTNNARGTSYITHGFTKTSLRADFTDATGPKGSVTLTRGTGTKAEHNAYVISPPDTSPSASNAPETVFTKLAGEVPDEVAQFMTLPGDPTLTFAGQFDKPYLLDASPTEVARTLASLTNVHTIFNAAREANRVRLSQAATLRTRTTDLEVIRLRTEEFKNLAAARAHQAHAEAAVERANHLAAQVATLQAARAALADADLRRGIHAKAAHTPLPDTTEIEKYASTIHRVRREAGMLIDANDRIAEHQHAALSPIPEFAPVEAAHEALSAYKAVLVRLRTAKQAEASWGEQHTNALVEWGNAQDAYIEALTAIGTCPTCGQDTKAIDHTSVEKIHV